MSLYSDSKLSLDVKRSMMLAEYIKCSGLPESREILRQESGSVELYVFPGEDMDQVTRLVTIGLSSCTFNNSKSCNSELLLVLPFDVVDDELIAINLYVSSIASYILNTLGRNIKNEETVNSIPEAPECWPSSILFDAPRGEPNELNQFYIGMQHVALSWVVPIYGSECEFINRCGIDAFDSAVANEEVSLVEVRREACI